MAIRITTSRITTGPLARLQDELPERRMRVVAVGAPHHHRVPQYDVGVTEEDGVGRAIKAHYAAISANHPGDAYWGAPCPVLMFQRLPDGIDDWRDPAVVGGGFDTQDGEYSEPIARVFAPPRVLTDTSTPAQKVRARQSIAHVHEIALRCSLGVTLETIKTLLTRSSIHKSYVFTDNSLRKDTQAALEFVDYYRSHIWGALIFDAIAVRTLTPFGVEDRVLLGGYTFSPVHGNDGVLDDTAHWNLLQNQAQPYVDSLVGMEAFLSNANTARITNRTRLDGVALRHPTTSRINRERHAAAERLTSIHPVLLEWVCEMLRATSAMWRIVCALYENPFDSRSMMPKAVPAFISSKARIWDAHPLLTRVQVYLEKIDSSFAALTRGSGTATSFRSLSVLQDTLAYYDAVVLPLRLLDLQWAQAWQRVLEMCDSAAPPWAPEVEYVDADSFHLPM